MVLWSEVEGELGREEAEGGAVEGCWAVGGYGGAVGFCGVAFVDVPAIHGVD